MTIDEIKEWRKEIECEVVRYTPALHIINTLLSEVARLHDIEAEVQRCHKTLNFAGFVDLGGEVWKPPIQNVGVFVELDKKLATATKALRCMCSTDTDSLWKVKEIGREALNQINHQGENK